MGEVFSVGASLLGAASGSSGGSATAASGAAMIAAGEEIIDYTDEYRKTVRKDTKNTRRNSYRAINSVPIIAALEDLPFKRSKAVGEFIGQGNYLADQSYGLMTEQKREGLRFSLGGADALMRKAQGDFAALAAGDTSSFSREVKASAFGAIAEAAGLPLGAFANTSAKNMMLLRESGVKNALGISDFFAKQGTVDPINPIDSIFNLAKFEAGQDEREENLSKFNRSLEFSRLQTNLQANLEKAGMKVSVESQILDVLSTMEWNALQQYADALKFAAGGAGADQLGAAQSQGALGQSLADIGAIVSEPGSAIGGFLGGIFG